MSRSLTGKPTSTSTVNVGVYPLAIAVNTATNIIYVANNVSNTVTAINGVTLHTTNISVGQRPRALAINPLTNRIYCANSISNDVTVINGATNATTPIPVGVTPVAIAVSQTYDQIYVANYNSSSLSVIDGRTMSVTAVSTGAGPGALAVDPVANRIYVANAADNSTTIVNLTTLQTTTIAVGASPTAVDVDLFTNKVYFTNMVQQGTVTMLNGQDYSLTTVDVGHNPIAIATNAVPNRIYVVNNGSNTVSVLGGGTSDALQFKPITPCRLVDTRSSPGPFGGPAIAGGTWRNFALPQGPCNVPSTAAAYSLNVTVVPHGSLGYLTVWPAGKRSPLFQHSIRWMAGLRRTRQLCPRARQERSASTPARRQMSCWTSMGISKLPRPTHCSSILCHHAECWTLATRMAILAGLICTRAASAISRSSPATVTSRITRRLMS